jgi:hypothetical protein
MGIVSDPQTGVTIPQSTSEGSAVDDLLKTVQEKTGLDVSQAKGAIEAVLGFVKDKLPDPIADQLDGLGWPVPQPG